MSKRAAQIGAEMRRAMQAVLDRGLQDPRASGALLTITEVRLSDDLRNATVLVSIMPESREELAMHGLRSAASHLRRQVGTAMELRQVPELVFKLDKTVKKQADVLEAIARATAERQAAEAAAAEGQPPINRPSWGQSTEPRPETPADDGPDAGPQHRGA